MVLVAQGNKLVKSGSGSICDEWGGTCLEGSSGNQRVVKSFRQS